MKMVNDFKAGAKIDLERDEVKAGIRIGFQSIARSVLGAFGARRDDI